MNTRATPFEHAVQRHGATVLRVCRAVVGEHDADDAWSETFLAALRAWPSLPADTNVEAWLVTIAHRKAIDVTRRRARHAVPIDDPQPAAEPDHAAGVVRNLDLATAVAVLPHKQRLCVAYHHLAGLSHREVAQLVGGSEASARRAAADGVARLRETYGTEPHDDHT